MESGNATASRNTAKKSGNFQQWTDLLKVAG
jgi:hypothetical protein